jgi:hypothetical protein
MLRIDAQAGSDLWGSGLCGPQPLLCVDVIPDISGQAFTLIHANFISVLCGELGIGGGRRMIEDQPLLVGIDLAIDSLFFLWAAVSQKTRRILYASSSAAYPISRQCDGAFSYLTEDMIDFAEGVLAPDMTYGWSKLTGEYLARLAVERNQLRIGIVRPFSGYGEDQDPAYPVPAIALRIAARQNPIRVWGSGMQGRDFVHIDDWEPRRRTSWVEAEGRPSRWDGTGDPPRQAAVGKRLCSRRLNRRLAFPHHRAA